MTSRQITWTDAKVILTVIGATTTIVASVVMSYARLDNKLDMVISEQQSTSKIVEAQAMQITSVTFEQGRHDVRISQIEKLVQPYLSWVGVGGGEK